MMGTLGRVVILEGHLHMSVPAWEKLSLGTGGLSLARKGKPT